MGAVHLPQRLPSWRKARGVVMGAGIEQLFSEGMRVGGVNQIARVRPRLGTYRHMQGIKQSLVGLASRNQLQT